MSHLIAVVLAAGEVKRMKSKKSKLLHEICNKPLVEWVYQAARDSGVTETVLVVGHKADQVKEYMGDRVKYALQEKQLGTGHAVMQAVDYLKDKTGSVMVLYGDTPLITSQALSKALDVHIQNNYSATIITAELENPTGYGRIVRSGNGDVLKIVEQRDADEETLKIKESNPGMYCFNIQDLLEALKDLKNDNSQGEYYLTDTIQILIEKGHRVGAVRIGDSDEVLGINDRLQLAEASEIMRKRILSNLMRSGVTIINPASTYIDNTVKIGIDTIIYPGTIIEGDTVIGEDCIIGPNSRIVSSTISDGAAINNSIVLESIVGECTKIGPFSYIRPQSTIGKKVKIGDFVEIKKSVIGDKTSISHLTYVGDAEVGKNVNLGCGVVFVNYDGKHKNKTIVGDNAFVGCNTNLISPVEVEANTYIAAGSTITDKVPENSLAIARERQVIKDEWVTKKGMQRK